MAFSAAGTGMKIVVKNTFVDDFFSGDEECENGTCVGSLKRSSSEGELSRHSTQQSSESNYMFWMPPLPACREFPVNHGMNDQFPVNQVAKLSSDEDLRNTPHEVTPPHNDHGSFVPGMPSGSKGLGGAGTGADALIPGPLGQGAPQSSLLSAAVQSPFQQPQCVPKVDSLLDTLHQETSWPIAGLEELQRDGVLEKIPRNDEGEISSVGSIQHAEGTCIPCAYWFRNICTQSLTCTYCHFRHPGQKNKRKKPNKRTRELIREAKAQCE
eukprot:TRINITY_DN25177_c0_g1_i1.p1 TRINITY_DN25177_c0_g1~~TRINITY_DN25177_c0_g1_i1.p1  ORF type:complete len:269 (+),score=40.85 TRINITY_DN25177_c0_g1_i1:53-859(+)